MSDWSDGLMMRDGGYEGIDPTTLPPVNVVGQREPPPDTGGGWPTYTAPPPADTSSGSGPSGFMDFLNQILPGMSDGGYGFGGLNPNMIPLLATALNQYNNSGKYMDLATKYADQMNPFGSERDYYKAKLKALEEDPNAYLGSSPDFQAALKQGLGAVDRSAAAKGYAGSGTGTVDVMDYASGLGAKYLDRDRQSLMQMAGANIGPAAAAGLISEGMKGSIDSQNQALANLFGAFTKPDPRNGGGPGQGGGGPGGYGNLFGNGGVSDIFRGVSAGGGSQQAIDSGVRALMARGWSANDANSAIRAMLNGTGTNFTQNGEPWSPTNPDGYHPYPTQGGSSEGTSQNGDSFTDPSTGETYYYVDGQWMLDPGPNGGYAPGEPGYDTGGSTPWEDFGFGSDGGLPYWLTGEVN